LLTLGVTIFDTTLVTISRARRGLLPLRHPEKITPHIVWQTWAGATRAVLTLYLLGTVSGALAVLVCYISAIAAFLLAVFIIGAMLAAIAMLEKAPFERQAEKAEPSDLLACEILHVPYVFAATEVCRSNRIRYTYDGRSNTHSSAFSRVGKRLPVRNHGTDNCEFVDCRTDKAEIVAS